MAKKNDFSSKNPLMSEYYESRAIRASNANISYPIQQSLFGGMIADTHKKEGLKVKLGNFYELVTRGLYGGQMKTRQNFDCSSGSLESITTSEPDVTSKKFHRESKGVNQNEYLKLSDEQIAKYAHLNNQKHGKEIRFDIYRHGADKLEANYSKVPTEKLVNDLTKKTIASISLPFSVIFNIYASKSDLTSRYEGDAYLRLTRFKSKAINSMLLNPEKTLKEFGLNTKNYIIKKNKISQNIKVNGKRMKQFPILTIEDKNPEAANQVIRDRIENCDNLPTNFVLEYAKMARDEDYIRKYYDKLDKSQFGIISPSAFNVNGLIGSLFEDQDLDALVRNDEYWKKGIEAAGLSPSEEIGAPF